MNVRELKKVSDITYKDVADYIRLDELDQNDINTLKTELAVARSYVEDYTGLDDLDVHSNLVIVVLILCQDMWDNRTRHVEKSTVNPTVESILNMHARNLL